MKNPNTPLEGALYFASLGGKLFPVVAGTKRPLVKWRKESTSDRKQIEKWAAKYPDCSWGIDVGKSRWIVLDVDNKPLKDGFASLAALELEFFNDLPPTLTVTTPSAGKHHFYHKADGETARRNLGFRLGLDYMADGAYVVCPGSVGSNGKVYSLDAPILSMAVRPDWLAKVAFKEEYKPLLVNVASEPDDPANVAAAISYLQNDAPDPSDYSVDNKVLFQVCCELRGYAVSVDRGAELLEEFWNCRAVDPWSDKTLKTTMANAYKYGQNSTGCKTQEGREALAQKIFEVVPTTSGAPVVFDDGGNDGSLPDIDDAASMLAQKMPLPIELVEGILHQGSKFSYSGSSKALKTWVLLDLAVSVATGKPWIDFSVQRGRVLFINLEVQKVFTKKRIEAICNAKGVTLGEGDLDVWNLRGHSASYLKLIPKIIERAKAREYALIIIDPIYKLYGEAKENEAGDVALLLNSFEKLAVKTGAAIAYAQHFSKGNQANKESIDRASGSGVFARDPDSLVTVTHHKQEDAFTVDVTLRNFPPMKPFVVRWDFPLMKRAANLDPKQLKTVNGRPVKATSQDILALLADGQRLTTAEWQKVAYEERGVSRALFFELLRSAKLDKSLKQDSKKRWHKESFLS